MCISDAPDASQQQSVSWRLAHFDFGATCQKDVFTFKIQVAVPLAQQGSSLLTRLREQFHLSFEQLPYSYKLQIAWLGEKAFKQPAACTCLHHLPAERALAPRASLAAGVPRPNLEPVAIRQLFSCSEEEACCRTGHQPCDSTQTAKCLWQRGQPLRKQALRILACTPEEALMPQIQGATVWCALLFLAWKVFQLGLVVSF